MWLKYFLLIVLITYIPCHGLPQSGESVPVVSQEEPEESQTDPPITKAATTTTEKPTEKPIPEESSDETTPEDSTLNEEIKKEKLNETCNNGNCNFDETEKMKPVLAGMSSPINDGTSIIGSEKCDSDELCSKSVPSSHCKEGICQCLDGHFISLDSKQCLIGKLNIGDKCEVIEQCVSKNCNDGVCAGPKVLSGGVSSEPNESSISSVSATLLFIVFLAVTLS